MSKIDKKAVLDLVERLRCGDFFSVSSLEKEINALPSIDEGFTPEHVRQLILAAQMDALKSNFKGPDYYINNHPNTK